MEKVCNKVSKRFKFSCYDVDDIYQEAYLICYDLLDKWDGRKLENFLTNAASNNLRTFIKKKIGSFNEKIKESKQKIDAPSPIYGFSTDDLPAYWLDQEGEMDEKLLFEKIEDCLPLELRKNYLKLKAGGKLPYHKKEEILAYIRESFVQSVLPRAETVYGNIEGIPFSSGILGSDEYGYLVKYTEKIDD